ncbi:tRNA methyltransferase RSM22 Ecym_8235 [Eremothecium cymbalariae DBVPG|uniref:37S ribosomal protein S22 n=1 Tax=Eremothecium cymbalariae (strain CBS 270.75 / DBVPG 7215 / KCTC 17166 / NRRL Y-17582) TaxID=931890 RepID=G8JXE6_ERECY|nr:Hypothetical protein Ecym_8235 [Eremothecium cymbalariae DBVPG\
MSKYVLSLIQRRLKSRNAFATVKATQSVVDSSTRDHSFGTVVSNGDNMKNLRVVEREEHINTYYSPFRDDNGSLIRGSSSKEARLADATLQGMFPRGQIKLNSVVAQTIQNNILSLHIPSNLRRMAAKYFSEIYGSKLHRQTASAMEVDAHIASVFMQNYGAIYQSLSELKKRLGDKFSPQRVLDVGYGPATGIVALNDLMGKDYKPELKEATILGHIEMQKRAKIILSRQLNEIPDDFVEDIATDADEIPPDDSLVGEVMTKKIRINTKLRKDVPGSKQYDLIIISHQLLKNDQQFPMQIDDNVEHFLSLLAPGGHMVIIERGNPLGFEITARARQIMIRPENFPNEYGKIPRPWIRGSHKKPQQPISSSTEAGAGNEVDYHLKIIAPCPHQGTCPLQVGKPQYYELKDGKALNFCNFQKTILRPRYTIELKKGKVLATPWETPTEAIGIKGKSAPGSGRPNGRDYELLNWSYLVVERAYNDPETVAAINKRRQESIMSQDIQPVCDEPWETWPRIIRQPVKRRGHVVMDLCAPSGQFEKWTVSKSFSKQIYHDARKAMKGDLWALDAKTKLKGMGALNVAKLEKLNKERIKQSKKLAKQKSREIRDAVTNLDHPDPNLELSSAEQLDAIANLYADEFLSSNSKKDKKYKK